MAEHPFSRVLMRIRMAALVHVLGICIADPAMSDNTFADIALLGSRLEGSKMP
jgi:hypothetical protein